jgi:hypothetical protein
MIPGAVATAIVRNAVHSEIWIPKRYPKGNLRSAFYALSILKVLLDASY